MFCATSVNLSNGSRKIDNIKPQCLSPYLVVLSKEDCLCANEPTNKCTHDDVKVLTHA